ncbi:uncharacterized protein BT62DRAFT_60868 [Guyanagaster necrorhizus]|uniref:Uncharacterized protein n=1 Tax=Guyanagaster necrorhizus TaxID=856835 RepID=A0A9P8ATD9_9AGAR|nr:uncharacterized protein BT62DRAFT_60868 [Guyanagaster necrorhizus MCA 3950]KAG7447095.1 hypothetical protein BT62DRAFT_60868 [Guyanagaster necrorhizus MCA 3950]
MNAGGETTTFSVPTQSYTFQHSQTSIFLLFLAPDYWFANGHSGIGKSVFLFYLSYDVCKSPGILCSTSLVEPFCSKDGVRVIDLTHYPLQLIRHGYLFPTLASSRSEELYSSWAKRRYASRFVMNPWSDEEISIGAELLSCDATLVLYVLCRSLLSQVLNFCGFIIRDVYSRLLSQGSITIIDRIYGPHPRVSSPASKYSPLFTAYMGQF